MGKLVFDIVFLSCLYGSELLATEQELKHLFLSCLYGSERHMHLKNC